MAISSINPDNSYSNSCRAVNLVAEWRLKYRLVSFGMSGYCIWFSKFMVPSANCMYHDCERLAS